jgi:predicted transcriptional regulator
MAETTSIKLPPKLKARVAALAKRSGRSPHSLILEAIERHAEQQERMEAFVKEALAAGVEIDEKDEVYRSDDVHAWIERLARGEKPAPPKPWRK